MVLSTAQEVYDTHSAGLPAGERLRLVELITRGMAGLQVELEDRVTIAAPSDRGRPGWQAGDRRGDNSEWRDRAL
jgi:hypothetical protein